LGQEGGSGCEIQCEKEGGQTNPEYDPHIPVVPTSAAPALEDEMGRGANDSVLVPWHPFTQTVLRYSKANITMEAVLCDEKVPVHDSEVLVPQATESNERQSNVFDQILEHIMYTETHSRDLGPHPCA
jgi:hypothetical protein